MSVQSLKPTVSKLYDQDFVAWAFQTARLLRAGRLEEIDAESLAEEVEAMAGRDQREVVSRLKTLLLHLLKWRYQAGKRSRSWQKTIDAQRVELEDVFEQSPSLRATLPEALAKAYPRAVRTAGIETGLPAGIFPAKCPFSREQILSSEFLPEPRR